MLIFCRKLKNIWWSDLGRRLTSANYGNWHKKISSIFLEFLMKYTTDLHHLSVNIEEILIYKPPSLGRKDPRLNPHWIHYNYLKSKIFAKFPRWSTNIQSCKKIHFRIIFKINLKSFQTFHARINEIDGCVVEWGICKNTLTFVRFEVIKSISSRIGE